MFLNPLKNSERIIQKNKLVTKMNRKINWKFLLSNKYFFFMHSDVKNLSNINNKIIFKELKNEKKTDFHFQIYSLKR